MLDIDTLNALHDLMANTLYAAEVARLPTLTRAEEEELATRARRGDEKARAALVASCLRYALGKARFAYNTRRPHHDELLDLVQVASLEMVRRLDLALTKTPSGAYLRGIAVRAISIYLTYFSGLIPLPTHATRETMATFDIPAVERLDVPAYRGGTRLKVDIIEVAPLPDDEELEDAEQREARFAPLYEALQQLTPKQRNAVVKRFRLGDDLLDPSVGIRASVPLEAVQKLRTALEGHLKQMLSPEQQE